jgi:hypothetical protein
MRKQFFESTGRLRRYALEHVLGIPTRIVSVELGELDEAHDGGRTLPGPLGPGESQFDLPRATGRMRFSTWLLSIGSSPSSM